MCRPDDASEAALNPLAEHDKLQLVGQSPAIKKLRVQIERIAPHFRSVLVRGERGSGKELVARMLHAARGRSEPFLFRNAADVESCRRANDPAGRFMEGAKRGTLFLDDVEQLSLPSQDWLLRMLGGGESALSSRGNRSKIEMRMIASTTDDLRTLAAAGRFRQKLYQRLAAVEIAVPPLRARMEDLPELAGYFMDRFRRLYERPVHRIAPEAMRRLQEHRWPGNVRELSDVIRDAVLQSSRELLEMQSLALLGSSWDEAVTTNSAASVRLQDVVERHVLGVLKDCDGNKLRAAELLGISRSTLYRMLETGNSAPALL
ncbi:MAG: sigma 54-interacting transcriptional regulator [Edaphobacter sp.]